MSAALAPFSLEPAARASRLLGVVRSLIAFGRHLADALLHRDPNENPVRLIRHFGVRTVTEIVERVAYALRLAMALEVRLSRWQSKPLVSRTVAAPARVRVQAAPRVKWDPEVDEPPPEPLPGVEELVRMIRKRPVGDVIVEICREFGIASNHPLWREIYDALLVEPTNSAIRWVQVIVHRRYMSWTIAPLIGEETVDDSFWPPALLMPP